MRHLRDTGLLQQLPSDHPLLKMYDQTVDMTHPDQRDARSNYMKTVSRTLHFVQQWLVKNNRPPNHCVDLLLAPQAIVEYLDL